jgi:hypothetical protein
MARELSSMDEAWRLYGIYSKQQIEQGMPESRRRGVGSGEHCRGWRPLLRWDGDDGGHVT